MIVQLFHPTSRRTSTPLPSIPPLNPSDIDDPVITFATGYIFTAVGFRVPHTPGLPLGHLP